MASEAIDELAVRRTLQAQHDNLKSEVERLKSGGGGGTSDNMVTIKEYVDKADEAMEARVYARLDKVATKGTVWAAVATAVGSILGVTLAVLAFAGDRFDAGMSMSTILAEQRKRDDVQDKKLDEILKRLPPPDRTKQ